MTGKTKLRIAHLILFMGFAIAAVAAIAVWQTTDELEGLVVGATIAAFVATISTFLERIFPMGER